MNLKPFFLLMLCLLNFATAFGQEGNSGKISGTLLDASGNPLGFANILLLRQQDSTLVKGDISSEDGTFTFEKLPEGQYIVQITMVGLQTYFSDPVSVSSAKKDILLSDITMKEDAVALEEIKVTATRPFIELQHDKVVVNVENSPVAAGKTALEVLSKAPGVYVDKDNNISLKGKQGVLILINGKDSHLSAAEIARMLESMSSEEIVKVELVHSPSAKYEAKGNAGIINIILKKNEQYGLNGSVNGGSGQGRYNRRNGGANLNFRHGKVNVFGNGSYSFNQSFQDLYIYRNISFEGRVTAFDQDNSRKNFSESYRYRGGIDLDLDDRTVIGILVDGSSGLWNENGITNTGISGDLIGNFSKVFTKATLTEEWRNNTINLNAKHTFKENGAELSVDADYAVYNGPGHQLNSNYFLNDSGDETDLPNLLRTENKSETTINALKADYSLPLGENSKFEVGTKTSWVETDNSIDLQRFNDESWQTDPDFSNAFEYKEAILAGYFNFSTKIESFNVQAGLRAEHTETDGYSVTLDQRIERSYLDWFPSISVSHTIAKKHSLSYAVSRRIDRPVYDQLNPFLFFLDQYTFGKGNPFLRPQYTNSATVSYSHEKGYLVSLSYGATKNSMTQVLEQDEANNTTFQTTTNLSNFYNYSLTVSAPIVFTEWWSGRLNASAFQNKIKSDFSEGPLDQSQFSFYGGMDHTFKLGNGYQMEVSGFYRSSALFGIFDIQPLYSVDLGFSKSILEGKGNLKLSLNDIFYSLKERVFVKHGDLDVIVRQQRDSRRAYLSFNYRFGNDKVKQARRRESASGDEQNRARQN